MIFRKLWPKKNIPSSSSTIPLSHANIEESITNDLPHNNTWLRYIGYVVLTITFVIFGGWAAVANLSSAAVAPGVIAVKSSHQTVQHLEGGIVKQILVEDGDHVKKHQLLVVLDDTQSRARLEIVRSRLLSLVSLKARLKSEQELKPTIEFPKDLVDRKNDLNVKVTLEGQLLVFDARRASIINEKELQLQTIAQLRSKIKGLEAVMASRKKMAKSYNEEAKDERSLAVQGLSSKQRLLQLERLATEMEGNAAEQLAAIATSKLQISEVRQQMLLSDKERHEEIVTELRDVQSQIFDLDEQIIAMEDMVFRTLIRAPGAGIIVGLGVHTVGAVIAPGTKILTIVPQNVPFIVETKISPHDIDDVIPGLTADIRLSAFSFKTTPIIMGTVTTVSADKLFDDNTRQDYYLAKIKISEDSLTKIAHLTLVPGMPVEVMIKTGERTLLAYLLQPLTDSLARSFKEA